MPTYFTGPRLRNPNQLGRPKGAKNKLATTAKQAIESVFMGLGGWESMMEWAKENKDCFYGQVFPKLLPVDAQLQQKSNDIRVLVYAPQSGQTEQQTVVIENTRTEQNQ